MKKQTKIIKAEDLPENEKVYMKKSMGEWKVVYPLKKEDGNINWFNVLTGGSWLKFFMMLIVVMMIIGVAVEYKQNISYCNDIISKLNNQTNIKILPDSNMDNLLNISMNNYKDDIKTNQNR